MIPCKDVLRAAASTIALIAVIEVTVIILGGLLAP